MALAYSMQVTSPFGHVLHHKENVTHGQFAFTTSEAGNHIACLSVDSNPGGGEVSVLIDWRTGIAAKDWESVAKKEKIQVCTTINYIRKKIQDIGRFLIPEYLVWFSDLCGD